MKYYNLSRNWTRKIQPHLDNKQVKEVLVKDFNKFTYGRWNKRFTEGRFPFEFESCDWFIEHRGPWPRYWKYVKHAACHWLVNFALRLAMQAEPSRSWRIITSDKHSTVWDGKQTLFEFNFQAFGITPQECYDLAYQRELPPGKLLRVYKAQHYSVRESENHGG